MRNETLRHKKLARKRKIRKDYERRRNINRYPPSEVVEETRDVFHSAVDKKGNCVDKQGRALVVKVGTRTILKRVKKPRPKDAEGNDMPIIAYPKSRKYRLSNKEITRRKVAAGNFIRTATNN